MKTSLSFIAVAVLVVLSGSACSKPPTWHRLDLPAGAEVRDLADCDGTWWAVGALHGAPAAWTSTDGLSFGDVPFVPLPTSYYGPHDVITSVACGPSGVAMIGAIPGGAHGNPRVSTWHLDDGKMQENPATFETYGGDRAVDVGPLGAGPRGFAIAGNRSSGAAAWLSPDAHTFTLFENVAGLASDGTHETIARDAVAMPDGRWAIVGGAAVPKSLDELAAVWLTTDGKSWTRDDPPAGTGFNEIQRAVRQGDDVVAAGMRGTAFGLWRWHAGGWETGATFGGDPGGVRSLAVAAGKAVVAGGGLWIDGRAASAPTPPVAVAGRGRVLLLAGAGGLWRTQV